MSVFMPVLPSPDPILSSKADFSISWRKVILFILGFGILMLDPYCVAICFIVLSIYSLFGRKQALESIVLSVIVKYANPALVAFPPASGLYTWSFLFIVSISLLFRSNIRNNTLFAPLTVLYITILCISFWSAYPIISMLKATSFYVVVLAVLSGSLNLKENELCSLSRSISSIFFVVFVLSIPFYFVHNVGFLVNGRGFQGILNHPQAFGTLWVPICVWIISHVFFVKNFKNMKLYIFLICCLMFYMFASKARTSVVATGLAFFLSFPAFLTFRAKKFGVSTKKGIVLVLSMLVVVLSLLGTSGAFSEAILGFLTKGQVGVSVGEAFFHSRGHGVEGHWENFMKSPWVGSGFGVEASADFALRVKYLMGIPVSASSEKGIVYSAILEEIGVIGLMVFLFFLAAIFSRAVRLDPPFMAMLFSCLTVNIGEAVLFSVNGNGVIYWVLIGLCLASGTCRFSEKMSTNPLWGRQE